MFRWSHAGKPDGVFYFMALIKIQRFFGAVPNELLNNSDISFKAKGLYAYLNSKPDNWDFSVESISDQVKEGIDSVRAGIHELEKFGYLKRIKYQNEKGYWEIDYMLFESPSQDDPHHGKPNEGEHPKQYKKELTKKENTKKEDNTRILDFGDWSDPLRVWIDYKKKMRKPYKTDRGILSALRDLQAVCKNDVRMAMPVVEYCMGKEWQGIYAPKEPLKSIQATTGNHINNEDYKLGKMRYRRQHEFALYADYVKHCQQYGHTIKPQGYDYDNGI
jgi:hypothetical protein